MEIVLKADGFKPIYKGIPPFMKYEGGHGYYGVLLEEEETGKLQCHLCGRVADNLSKHLHHKHKGISPRDYRVKTGLNLTTPLMSEKTRKFHKNNFLNLTPEKREALIKRLKENNGVIRNMKKRKREAVASLEMNNRYGTCPEQVRSQFYETYNKLGRIPNWLELSGRLRYIIETRFGNYETALVAWGIPREEYQEHRRDAQIKATEVRRENDYFPKYEAEKVRKIYGDFFKENKRLPTWGEVAMYGMPGRVPFARAFGCNKEDLLRQLLST